MKKTLTIIATSVLVIALPFNIYVGAQTLTNYNRDIVITEQPIVREVAEVTPTLPTKSATRKVFGSADDTYCYEESLLYLRIAIKHIVPNICQRSQHPP